MALQFDPGPYLELFRMRQAQEEANRPDINRDFTQPFLQGLQAIQQNRQQQELMRFRQSENAREQAKFDYEYGRPIDPNIQVGVDVPRGTMPSLFSKSGPALQPGVGQVGSGGSLVDQYNAWKAGGMKGPARPEYADALGAKGREEMRAQEKLDIDRIKAEKEPSYVIQDYSSGKLNLIPLEKGLRPTAGPKMPGQEKPNAQILKAKGEVGSMRGVFDSVTKEIDRVQELNKNSRGGLIGAAQQAASSAFNFGTESPEFINTADVINTMQAQVAKVLKSTFGGQLSEGEREYLNGVYGALGKLSPQERDIAMTNVKAMLKSKLEEAESKFNEMSGYISGSPGNQPQGNDPLGIR